jgi:hypothetical protein
VSHPSRYSPEQAERLVALLRDHFFTRTDLASAFMSWGKPHPVDGGEYLQALLEAHVNGQTGPKAVVRFTNRDNSTKVASGWYRVGTHTPDTDGNTRWLCVDFDGADHADGLVDPDAAVLSAYQACADLGVAAHIERSGGGHGWHLWVLFSEPVPAADARRLAQAVVPADLPLVSGRTADPRVNRGIEVFPKQDRTKKKGFGNFVWLPLWSEAPEGANQFYRVEDGGNLARFLPDTLETADRSTLERAIESLAPEEEPADPHANAPAPAPSDRAVADPEAAREFLTRVEQGGDDDPDDPATTTPAPGWSAWRKAALAALPLESVYGPWLTGASNSEHWLECRDPDSPSGDRDPSAGVADGTGEAARGTFHSFRTSKKLSVFDFLMDRGLAANFKDAVRKIADLSGVPLPEAPKRAAKTAASPRSARPSRAGRRGYPVIVTNNRQLRDIIADARQVVNHANGMNPTLFNRVGQPVRLAMVDGKPQLDYLDDTSMYGVLARMADWVKRNDEGEFDVMPPHDVARDMIANVDPALPLLDAVVTAPVFDKVGNLVAAPGFHRDAGLWHHEPSGFHVAPVPEVPTPDEVAVARSLLLDHLLVDFPFAGPSDLAHAVAAVILPFIRRMVSGSTPIHLIEAPVPGTGKTLLADAVTRIATGHQAEPTTLGRDDEETRKKITSVLSLGKPVLLIDNVRAGIDSATLAAALTAETWQDRILGQNKMILLPNRAVWLVTANNPDLSMEIARRSLRIRIEPTNDRPWERGGFKHSPLTRWIDENRAALVQAVLVLVRAWQANGSPRGHRTLGSFEAWAEILGGILTVAGIPGFLENSEELYMVADQDSREWREFVQAWWDDYADDPQTVKTLLGLAKDKDMLASVLGDKSDHSQAIRLGKALAANRNRRFGTLQIRTSGSWHNQNRWCVVDCEGSEAPAKPVQARFDLGDPAVSTPGGMCGMSDHNIPLNIPLENLNESEINGDVGDVGDVLRTPTGVITCAHTGALHAHDASLKRTRGNIPHIPHIHPSPVTIEEKTGDVGGDVTSPHPPRPVPGVPVPHAVDLASFTEEEV